MSEEINVNEVTASLHELFKYAFITNSHLDEDSVTQEEMKTLTELDSFEVLENFKDLLVDLLNFKRDNRQSDTAELNKRSQQFESMIQKLEGEVRNHIRMEHQLKIHLEASQSKIDELQKTNDQISKELERFKLTKQDKGEIELEKSKTIDSSKQGSYKESDKVTQDIVKNSELTVDIIKKQYQAQLQKVSDLADRRQKVMQKLENEIVKLKTQLEEKSLECNRIRKEQEKLPRHLIVVKERRNERPESRNSDIDQIRRKIDDRTPDLKEPQSLLKPKPLVRSPLPTRKIIKPEYVRKSMGDFEWIKQNEIGPTKKEPEAFIKREDISIRRKRPSSKHARCSSESTRPESSRRVV